MTNRFKTDHQEDESYIEVAEGVWGLKTLFVNLYVIAINKNDWVLLDTGLKGYAAHIKSMANDLFGNIPPKAIILTHGHFDHTGNIVELLETWDVPVFAHQLEKPYLNGTSSYPPPDPTVGGGLMSLMSVVYPRKPINLGDNLRILQNDSHLPFLPDWEFIHTPGHSPGHISLFRQKDRLLIAGDAFVTTKQESAFSVATQARILSGPPKYFTYNWPVAKISVKKLVNLHPKIAATGHGKPMQGEELINGLNYLSENFEKVAIPTSGRYVNRPAKTGKRGLLYVPPKPVNRAAIASLIAVTGLIIFALVRLYKQ
ncbi:MBL fold metallo-hydrolase [Mucilaginibacter litoreus]|uniref:MBL fold metallo-hydrolase n=1 Tax=Mucilaginibacter litoreus TaxID=1048221 RepID=A0ABW3ATM1_9SPHI